MLVKKGQNDKIIKLHNKSEDSDLYIKMRVYNTSRFTCLHQDLHACIKIHIYIYLVKSNWWSIINAAFWLVELLVGYMS